MKNLITILVSVLVLFVVGCSSEYMADKLIPKQESEFAKTYLQRLQAKDYEYIKKYIDPSSAKYATDEKIIEVAGHFPSGELLSAELIGSQVNVFNGNWKGNFSFEFQFTNGWAVANVVLKKSDEKLTVIAISVTQTTASLKELNKFTLEGKSALHYLMLVYTVFATVFVLVTAYFCIRTPIPKRKWLWVVFVLVGIGSFSINWSTGQFGVHLLHFKLLAASLVTGGAYGQTIISASLPLGAIIFWFKRKRFMLASTASPQG